MKPVARGVLCGLLMLLAAPTVAQPEAGTGLSVLTGTVIDSEGRLPVSEVVVVATSPGLPDERTVVTDARGNYRIPRLPPGVYTLRFERELYGPHVRADIRLREKRTLRVTVGLVREAHREEATRAGRRPTTDVDSASTSVTVDAEFLRRIAMARPSKDVDAPCAHTSVAVMEPGAHDGSHGVSINSVTSPGSDSAASEGAASPPVALEPR